MANSRRFLLSPPELLGNEADALLRALRSGWIAPLGPELDAFEAEMAVVSGAAGGAATSSGTAALHLALRLAGVKPETTVILPSLTFVATANPVLYCGAKPVFVDCSPDTWNIDPELLHDELSSAAASDRPVSAVVVVHLFGHPADMDPILEICKEFDVPLIEDAAEALGARYKERPVGALGRFGVFSFNGNKIITTSAGGMLVSQDVPALERARFLASQAREPGVEYTHEKLGYNYRLSNILAALGREQLKSLEARISKKRKIFVEYQSRLGTVEGLDFMPEAAWAFHTRWLTTVLLPTRTRPDVRDCVIRSLAAEGVETRPIWKPLHRQPLFQECRFGGGTVADDLFARGLCLPSGVCLESDDIDRVCELMIKALRA